MSVLSQVVDDVGDVAKKLANKFIDWATSKSGATFLGGTAVGAALVTPTGQTLIKETISVLLKAGAGLSKAAAKAALKATLKAAATKVGAATADAAAAAVAGWVVGSWAGDAIAGFQGYNGNKHEIDVVIQYAIGGMPFRLICAGIKNGINTVKDKQAQKKQKAAQEAIQVKEAIMKMVPISTLKDWVKEDYDAAVKKASKWGAGQYLLDKMKYKGESSENLTSKKKVQESQEYDRIIKENEDAFAKLDDMVKRPKEGTTAETMWRREVENRMKRNGNDPAWYKKGRNNGIQYSGEYNFDTKNGNANTSPLMTDGTYKIGLPSIAAEAVALTVGKVTDDLIQNMYTDVTIKIKALNKNSALTSTWTRATLLKLVHTMRVLYAGWLCGTRAYMLVNEFDGSDQSLPAAYFFAMGFDWVTWQNNRAQIQEDLNYIASMLDVYVDFTKLDLFKRTEQLFLNGYTDGKSNKAQKIIFRGDGDVTSYYDFTTGSWNRAGNMIGAAATVISSTSTGATYNNWKTAMVAAVNSLVNSSTVQDMLSCLRYVFGTGERNFFKVPKSNDKFKFVYNEEVLSQIENSTPCVLNASTYSLADDTTNDWITEILTSSTFPTIDRRFNSHNNHMSKDDQIVSTRLQLAKLDGIIYYGTEVPTTFEIVVVDDTSSHYKKLEKYVYSHGMTLAFNSPSSNATDVRNAYKQIQRVALLATFDWAPIISSSVTIGSTNTTAVSATVTGILVADWESYAICYSTSVQSSLTWMSYMRNGNYSLHSVIQTEINAILDKAKTA